MADTPRALVAKTRVAELAAEAARDVRAATEARGGRPPILAAVIATEQSDVLLYMEHILKQAAAAGLAVQKVVLPSNADASQITAALAALSADSDVAGIIVQSPLPIGVDRSIVAESITPSKDVDGLTSTNAALLAAGDLAHALLPATAAAVMELLQANGVALAGKRAVIVGRSPVVGRPVAQLLRLAGAQVEVVHSQTPNPTTVTRSAEILVVAAGVRGLIRGDGVAPGAVVVDVGIHAVGEHVFGDVDAESVASVLGPSGALSPVPGGVGPMTNAVLVLQAARAAKRLAGA